MQEKSTAEKNTTPAIICVVPWRVIDAKPLQSYKLEVKFMDGTHGFVEMESLIMSDRAGIFSKLRDIKIFNQVYLEYGVVTWPGEIDLAPDAMHDEIKQHGHWVLGHDR